jgi:hypothetical protein
VSQEAFSSCAFFSSSFSTRTTTTHFVFSLLFVMTLALTLHGQVTVNQLSSDPFTNSIAQHATEVEASTFSWNNTIVTAFQQGRFFNGGGSSDNGWATSTDGGKTWTHGSLPGLTKTGGMGKYDRATDPAVAYDAKHQYWMIATLPLYNTGGSSTAMLLSRSKTGTTWSNPVTVTPVYSKPDKTWLSCDNNTGSPYYGNCYAEWDNNGAGDIVYLAVSSDGGKTWGTPVQPSTKPAMFGLQPLALSTGRVIAPGSDAFNINIESTTSTDGGKTFGAPVIVSAISKHTAAGGLRDLVLPTSAIDAANTVYTVWQDCRFRTSCAENDLVMSTTTDGTTWSAVTRIPIDPTTSTVDHFLPGLAIETNTSGSTAHLGLTYYYYPNTSCTKTTCQLEAGYISSSDGGSTWSTPVQLSNAMTLTWFPNTNQGFMPGDYESLAFVNGLAFPVFGIAKANSGTTFNVTMNAPVTGLTDGPGVNSSAGEKPVPNAHSDAAPRTTPVCDRCQDEEED